MALAAKSYTYRIIFYGMASTPLSEYATLKVVVPLKALFVVCTAMIAPSEKSSKLLLRLIDL